MKKSFIDTLSDTADEALRFLDFRLQRIDGGLMERLGISQHNADAIIWPGFVAAALWTGMPTFGIHLLTSVLVMAAYIGLTVVLLRGSSNPRRDLAVQCLLILALAAIVWVSGPEKYAEERPYRHLLVPIAAIVAVALAIVSMLVGPFFSLLLNGANYSAALKVTELFQSRGSRSPAGWRALARALLSVVARPLGWLFPTAVVAVTAAPDTFVPLTILALVFWIGFILLLGLNERLDAIWSVLNARFFRNAALALSLLIIALAIARFFEVTYVSTVLDTVQAMEILLFLFFAYALTWWYDYWIERLTGQELLKLVCAGKPGASSISYKPNFASPHTTVPLDGRVLQVHGLGRFLVCRDIDPSEPRFHTWKFRDFFYHLAASGHPGGKAVPPPSQIEQRVGQFTMFAGTTVTLLLLALVWSLHVGVQQPQVLSRSDRPAAVSLADLLVRQQQAERPSILVAASGGGTRAAVFTTAILEGLARGGRSEDVIAGSGVSGGAASLAYFAAQRQSLIQNSAGPAWETYVDVMQQPFIRDVLERGSEWRIVSGGRLGLLLAESFERRWKLPADRDQLGDVADIGIILNTALAAHLDRAQTPSGRRLPLLPLAEVARQDVNYTRPDLAGGRLILTNLDLQQAFSNPPTLFGEEYRTPVVVDDKEVRLAPAAALSANFPPVFPNAAVDVDDRVRYWTTDGGAADNRGLEMLLYALRSALRERQWQTLPRVHVVVVEASAIDPSFRQDRGITTVQGAGAQFAARLCAELASSISELYRIANQQGRFQFHFVRMPRFLRAAGSFGTHWMLQDRIPLNNSGRRATATGLEVVTLLRALYGQRPHHLSGDAAQALEWASNTDEYRQDWRRLTEALRRDP